MIHFGIITPTYKRTRFLPSFIRNVQRQSHSNWTLAIIHDGPNDRMATEVVQRSVGSDVRIKYWATPAFSGDMGNGPRISGITYLAKKISSVPYILFWDDDNRFYHDALVNINRAIDETGYPDLLIVPIEHKWRNLPDRKMALRSYPMGNIDTANLCVKTETAIRHFEKSQNAADPYHQDFYFYRSICDDPSTTIGLANISNIGCYDGLRFWSTLRWKVCPRPLNVYDTAFMRRWRRLLPR